MRLRRFFIRLIIVLSQWFRWLSIQLHHLANRLKHSTETNEPVETAETNPQMSAESAALEDWLAHVRPNPPADWLDKVSQGAPQLLDPQLRPSRPPGPPPPRRQTFKGASSHRPRSATDRARPQSQPFKQIRFQPTRSLPNQSKVVPTASPLAETTFSSSSGSTAEPAEATDDGPPLSRDGSSDDGSSSEIINNQDKNQSIEADPTNWPPLETTAHNPTADNIATFSDRADDSISLDSLYPEEGGDGRTAEPTSESLQALESGKSRLQIETVSSNADPAPKTANRILSHLHTSQNAQNADERLLTNPEDQSQQSTNFASYTTLTIARLITYPFTWLMRLPKRWPHVGQDGILSNPERRLEINFAEKEQQGKANSAVQRGKSISASINKNAHHQPSVNILKSSPTLYTTLNVTSPIPENLWPTLAETAVQKSTKSITKTPAQIDFPTGRPSSKPYSKAMDAGQTITADFWPPLPRTNFDETAETESTIEVEERRRIRLNFEQRGPEWNE